MKQYFILLWLVFTCPLIAKEELTSRFIYNEGTHQPKMKLTYANNSLLERCIYHYNSRHECANK